MAAGAPRPLAAAHHFHGMGAPFARNQCTIPSGHAALWGRCMHLAFNFLSGAFFTIRTIWGSSLFGGREELLFDLRFQTFEFWRIKKLRKRDL